MSFFSKEPIYIGIEATSKTFRMIAIERCKKEWKILYAKEIAKEETSSLPSSLFGRANLVSILPQRYIMVRKVTLDLKKESDVPKALPFQIEPLLPFPVEEAIIQAEIEKKSPTGFIATVHVVKGDYIKKHLEQLEQDHILPDTITSPALSLASLLTLSPHENLTQFLVYIGEEESVVILAKGSSIIDQRSFLTEKSSELQRAILSLESQYPKESGKTLLLFGKNSSEWMSTIQNETKKNVHMFSFQLGSLSPEEFTTYALALGAALSQTKPKAIHFRQKQFQSKQPYKLIKKPLLLSITLTLLSFSLLLGGGTWQLNHKKMAMQNDIASLFQAQRIESPLGKKSPIEAHFDALDRLNQSLSQEAASRYPLEAKIPLVSELFHWISNELSKAPPPLKGILIEEIDYRLVSRPSPLASDKQYQMEVELIFSAHSPNAKEAMKEFLEKSTSLIDNKKPIQVTFFDGKGKAHFTLKDRTRYE